MALQPVPSLNLMRCFVEKVQRRLTKAETPPREHCHVLGCLELLVNSQSLKERMQLARRKTFLSWQEYSLVHLQLELDRERNHLHQLLELMQMMRKALMLCHPQ